MTKVSRRVCARAWRRTWVAVALVLAAWAAGVSGATHGVLDPTFDGDGRVTTNVGVADRARAVVVQPDGAIVVAGSTGAATSAFLVARYVSSGALDTTFNGTGLVQVGFSLGDVAVAQGLALQADGKLVVAGYTNATGLGLNDFAVVRLATDGTLDPTFNHLDVATAANGNGRLTIDFTVDDRAAAVAIQPDGRIVLAGSVDGGSSDCAVVRLTEAGALDPAFGTNGRFTFSFGGADFCRALALDGFGRIVLAGSTKFGTNTRMAVARVTAAGALDTSFDGDGLATFDVAPPSDTAAQDVDVATGVVIQPDGKIVLAGYGGSVSSDVVVLRLTETGALDPTFDGDGSSVTSFGGTETTGATVRLRNGKIAVVGTTRPQSGPSSMALLMLNTDGSPDATFDGDGKLSIGFGAPSSEGVGLAVQPDGPLVLVGASGANGGDVALARVGADTGLPPSLTITTPATETTSATRSFLTISGSAGGAGGVQSVTWRSSTGATGAASGTSTWSAEVPLQAGANVITVTARNAEGLARSASVTINVAELVYYLAEGATGPFFDYDLLLANPNAVAAPVTITFLRDDGVTGTKNMVLPATSRTTVRVDDEPNFGNAAVSAVVTSTAAVPLIVERSMYWDASYYGGHAGSSVSQPETRWLFAEGSQGFFDTYVLLANASASPVTATVRFLREFDPPVEKTYTVAATSRLNVYAGEIPELVNTSFSIVVEASAPIIAERAMYFGASPFWNGGHESAGVPAAATTWFLAEGATGGYFDTYVLIGNANATAATCTVTFLRDDGTTVVKTVPVGANQRVTLNVEDQDALLANTAVSTTVTSDVPVIVERAMYWPGAFTTWQEAHNSFGVTQTATKWGLAEGRSGGPHGFQTYILLANPSPTTAAAVKVTFLKTDGSTVVKTYSVVPTSRFNVDVSAFVPELDGLEYGALIEVTNGVPIAVERAVYNDANGVTWAAGTNATAVRLP